MLIPTKDLYQPLTASIWSYSIELWWCISNINVIQMINRTKNKILRILLIIRFIIKLYIPPVQDTIKNRSNIHH